MEACIAFGEMRGLLFQLISLIGVGWLSIVCLRAGHRGRVYWMPATMILFIRTLLGPAEQSGQAAMIRRKISPNAKACVANVRYGN